MKLYFDSRDREYHRRHNSRIIEWLIEAGAQPLEDNSSAVQGFLFAAARSLADYQSLTESHPNLRDRPAEREPLLRLDSVLDKLAEAGVSVPTPRTWRLALDAPLPDDLKFPLFLRTATTSAKLGGRISKVNSVRDLEAEAAELRRQLGWDSLILAREWCELAKAGRGMYGPIPQEVRIWIVDQKPLAWSFHYLGLIPEPSGFPPSAGDLSLLADMARQVARPFESRLIVADFARLNEGGWVFVEAGPGSCAGTAHEAVFKAVVNCLQGAPSSQVSDTAGGTF